MNRNASVFSAYLVTGATREKRLEEISKHLGARTISPWDIIRLAPGDMSIGISAVRDFQKELHMSPRAGSCKAGVIHDAHLLTIEAQNALLKTLEEPPPNTILFAETQLAHGLLPTILSRVTLVHLKEPDQAAEEDMKKILTELLHASAGRRLAILVPFETTRDEAKAFVDRAIVAARELLIDDPDATLVTLIKNLLAARSQLLVNVNQKLILDNIFLTIV